MSMCASAYALVPVCVFVVHVNVHVRGRAYAYACICMCVRLCICMCMLRTRAFFRISTKQQIYTTPCFVTICREHLMRPQLLAPPGSIRSQVCCNGLHIVSNLTAMGHVSTRFILDLFLMWCPLCILHQKSHTRKDFSPSVSWYFKIKLSHWCYWKREKPHSTVMLFET